MSVVLETGVEMEYFGLVAEQPLGSRCLVTPKNKQHAERMSPHGATEALKDEGCWGRRVWVGGKDHEKNRGTTRCYNSHLQCKRGTHKIVSKQL